MNKKIKGGFSLIELIIAMAISSIILTNSYILYIVFQKNSLMQEAITDMHQNARITMEFITRELRNALLIDPNTFSSSNISFYTDAYNILGTPSGANGTNTLKDSSKSWMVNEWKNKYIAITGGKGIGQLRTIDSNTSNQLVLNSAWSTIPDSSSIYHLDLVRKGFKRTDDNILRYSKGGSTNQTFADNISNIIFKRDIPAKKIDIELTARSRKKNPNNNQYHTYTLRSSLILRN